MLIEIKTPVTNLLGGRYRGGIFGLSAPISGSVAKVLTYRRQLMLDLHGLKAEDVEVFHPKCIVIAGDGERQLAEPERRRSFELVRASMRDVDVLTYDEVFKKAELLADLFSLAKGD